MDTEAEAPESQAPEAAPPGGPPVVDDDAVVNEDAAIALARKLMRGDDPPEDDDELDDVAPAADPKAAKPKPAAAKDPKVAEPKPDDEDDDELARLEADMRKRQDAQRRQAAAAATQRQEQERAIAAARDEGTRAAQAELAERMRKDPLGVLDDLGLDARTHYITLRDHAANPQARQPVAKPAAQSQGQQGDQFQAAVDRAVAAALAAHGIRPSQGAPPAERQQEGTQEAQATAAQEAFAQLAGDTDRFPLLSDLDPGERVRYGVLVATRRLSEGRATDNDLEEVAQETEDLLQKRATRQAARLARAKGGGKATTGGTGEGTSQEGAERTQPARGTSVPRTLTPDLASSSATPKTAWPDGIEPEEDRIAASIALAKQRRRQEDRERQR